MGHKVLAVYVYKNLKSDALKHQDKIINLILKISRSHSGLKSTEWGTVDTTHVFQLQLVFMNFSIWLYNYLCVIFTEQSQSMEFKIISHLKKNQSISLPSLPLSFFFFIPQLI